MDEILQLVKRIRGNDEDAFRELLERHKRMIFKIIYANNLYWGDYRFDENDLFQEASIALYQAVNSFDEKFNVKFSSYAYIVIRSRIKSVFREHYKRNGEGVYSFEHGPYTAKALMVCEERVDYEREEICKNIISDFMLKLKPLDKQILLMRRKGCSYKEIAKKLRVNEKTIDNHIMLMKRRVRKQLKELEGEDSHG